MFNQTQVVAGQGTSINLWRATIFSEASEEPEHREEAVFFGCERGKFDSVRQACTSDKVLTVCPA